jgi:hypothetical protein
MKNWKVVISCNVSDMWIFDSREKCKVSYPNLDMFYKDLKEKWNNKCKETYFQFRTGKGVRMSSVLENLK